MNVYRKATKTQNLQKISESFYLKRPYAQIHSMGEKKYNKPSDLKFLIP